MASIIIASLVILAIYVGTRRLSGIQTLAVIALAALGIILAIFPGLSSEVAATLHVGRGTDLIFYLAVLAGLFVVTNFYFRFKRHEEALIALARKNAIDNATKPQPPDAPIQRRAASER
jgi:hypothetical protein